MVAPLAEPPVPPDVALQPRRRFLWGSQLQMGKLRLREVGSRPGSHSTLGSPGLCGSTTGLASQTDWSQTEAGEILDQLLPPPWPSLSALTSVFPPVEWGCVTGEEGQLPGRSWLMSAPSPRSICPAPGLPGCFWEDSPPRGDMPARQLPWSESVCPGERIERRPR